MAQSVVTFFSDPEVRDEVEHLIGQGVKPEAVEVSRLEDHPFSGKTFVLTGTLQNHTRSGASALIKERGGKTSSSVSKKTDYLLAGSDPGSKFDKAKSLGVTILTEEEFESQL